MLLINFKRYFLSKKTIFLLLSLFIVYIFSFIFSYHDVNVFKDLASQSSADINNGNAKIFVQESKSLYYIFRFFFLSEFYHLYIYILLFFVGVFLSSESIMQLQNGFGTLILIRENYKKNIYTMILSQCLYIISLVFISTLLFLIFSLLFNYGEIGVAKIGKVKFGFFDSMLLLLMQNFIIIIFLCLVNSITLLTSFFIKQVKFIQGIPLTFFGFFPIILASTLGNLNNILATILLPFVPFEYLNILPSYYNGYTLKIAFIYLSILLIILGIFLKSNIKYFTKDYI